MVLLFVYGKCLIVHVTWASVLRLLAEASKEAQKMTSQNLRDDSTFCNKMHNAK